MTEQEKHWTYSFSVWPNETRGWSKDVFALFEHLTTRIEMAMTADQFHAFRSNIEANGLTLREIERVPHHEPETVL